jgi:hypothetical protein
MTTYSIPAPDGNTYKIEGPAGASQEQVIAEVLRQNPNAGKPPEKGNMYTQNAEDIQYSPEGIPLNTSSYGSEATGKTKAAREALTSTVSLPINVATGVAKNAAGLGQLVGKYFGSNAGDIPVDAINQIEKGTQAQMGDVGSAINQIGSAVGQTAPFMAGPIGMIPSMTQRVAGGVLGGITSGLLTPEKTGLNPEQFANEKAKNVAIQSALGGTIPLVGGVIKGGYNAVKSAIEPFYEGGQNLILGRALREFAGGQAPQAIENIRNAPQLVKGVQPTLGEVSGVPSLAAAQRAVSASSPEATNIMAQRQALNTEARTNALQGIATPTRTEKYVSLRTELGNDLYEPALNKGVDFSSLSPALQAEFKGLTTSPSIKSAMIQASKNAADEGKKIGNPANSLRGLHETKFALDSQINALEGKLANTKNPSLDAELKAKKSAKNRLLNFIENDQVSPEYKIARETFARTSKPVDQLDAIAKLAEKSVSPENQKIYSAQFSRNFAALKKEGILTERQINRLEAIKQDLERVAFAEKEGKGVGSDTVQKLAYSNMANQVGIPNALRGFPGGEIIGSVAQRVGKLAYGDANKELAMKLAETMANPQKAALLMEQAGLNGKPLTTENQRKLAKMLLMQSTAQAAQ